MKTFLLFFFTLLTINCFGAGATVSSKGGLATNLTAHSGVLIRSNSVFGDANLWLGTHSFNGEDTIYSEPLAGIVLYGASGHGGYIQNQAGSPIIQWTDSGTLSGKNILAAAATNALYASSPFIILHTNYSATVYSNGIAAAPTTITFPNSKTAGWNDIQALFHFTTNSPYNGFAVAMDDGRYHFTEPLLVTNEFCHIYGSSPASCIWQYDGPTNLITMQNVTNCLDTPTPGRLLSSAMVNACLLFVSTNKINQGGIEPVGNLNVILENFSIRTKTNMFCYGIGLCGGDHTVVNYVYASGPVLWDFPSHYSGFTDGSQIPEPNKMIGFLIGDNQPQLNHCRVYGVADGIVAMGDCQLTINDFNAVAIDYVDSDGTTPYPATSELSTQSAILIPKSAQAQIVSVDNILLFDCWNHFYDGNAATPLILKKVIAQNTPFLSFTAGVGIWVGANQSQSYVTIEDSPNYLPTVSAYTNDLASGFYVNGSATAYILQRSDQIGNFALNDGTQTFFSTDRNGLTFSGPIKNNVQVLSGHQFIGNASGMTNITAKPNLTFSTNTIYATTNTANVTINTNDLVPGAVNVAPNARFSVSVPVVGTATLSAGFYGALMYSNAADGKIYTADNFSISAGILAADTVTNTLQLADGNPNSLFWITNTTGGTQNISVQKINSTRVTAK